MKYKVAEKHSSKKTECKNKMRIVLGASETTSSIQIFISWRASRTREIGRN